MVNMSFDGLGVLIVANKGLDMYLETLLKSPWLTSQPLERWEVSVHQSL